MTRFRESQQEDVHNAAKSVIGEYMASPNSSDAMQANRAFSDSIYEQVKDLAAEVPNQAIRPSQTKPVAEALLNRYPDIFKKLQDTKMEGIIKNIAGDVADIRPRPLGTNEKWQEMIGDEPITKGRTVVSSPSRYNAPPENTQWFVRGGESDLDQFRRMYKGMTPEVPIEIPRPKPQPIPMTMTFDEAWELRKGLGTKIGQARKLLASGAVDQTEYGQLKALFSAVSSDIDNWASSIGREDISGGLRAANEAYKQYVVRYDVLSRAYDQSIREIGDQTFFSPAKFSNKLDSIVKKDKYLGTFIPKQKEELSGLANIMQVAKRAGQFHENVPTGNRFLDAWLIKEAVHTAEIPLAWVSTFLTTTKPGQAIVSRAAKIQAQSPEMANLIKQTYIQMIRQTGESSNSKIIKED
jgi:hypothetical protein